MKVKLFTCFVSSLSKIQVSFTTINCVHCSLTLLFLAFLYFFLPTLPTCLPIYDLDLHKMSPSCVHIQQNFITNFKYMFFNKMVHRTQANTKLLWNFIYPDSNDPETDWLSVLVNFGMNMICFYSSAVMLSQIKLSYFENIFLLKFFHSLIKSFPLSTALTMTFLLKLRIKYRRCKTVIALLCMRCHHFLSKISILITFV